MAFTSLPLLSHYNLYGYGWFWVGSLILSPMDFNTIFSQLPLSMITSQNFTATVHRVWKILCLSLGFFFTKIVCRLLLVTSNSLWLATMSSSSYNSYTSFSLGSLSIFFFFKLFIYFSFDYGDGSLSCIIWCYMSKNLTFQAFGRPRWGFHYGFGRIFTWSTRFINWYFLGIKRNFSRRKTPIRRLLR